MQSLKSCGQAIAGLIVLVIMIGIGISVCQNMTGEPDPAGPSERPRPTATPQATPTGRRIDAIGDRTPGVITRAPVASTADAAAKKCLSAWDYSHRETNELIKADLVSPDSFEHVDTSARATLTQGGRILVLEVEFSAENAFGARLRGRGFGFVDVRTCHAVDGGVIG